MIAALLAAAAAQTIDPTAGLSLGVLDPDVPISFDTAASPPTLTEIGGGDVLALGVVEDGVAVFRFDLVILDQDVEVRGDRPVAVLSRSDLTLRGASLEGRSTSSDGPPNQAGRGLGGGLPPGGGGGFGGAGGTSDLGGPGGIAYDSLTGGIQSGSGGAGTVVDGGFGGVGVELGAAGRVFLEGAIDLRGESGTTHAAGGGGGGSGGMLLVHAGTPGSTCTELVALGGGHGGSLGGAEGGGGGGGRARFYGLPRDCEDLVDVSGGLPNGGVGGVDFEERDHDGDGLSIDAGDCDDYDAAVSPDAVERCDGVDDDCDGLTDEDAGIDWFADADGDGHGGGPARRSCPVAGPALGSDCDDEDPAVFPGAPEVCDGVDQNCVAGADDGLPTFPSYPDLDGDGFGAPPAVIGCSAPPGYVATSTDCAPLVGTVHPGGIEVCDGIDQDCANGADDGLPTTTWYGDGDGDTWGAGAGIPSCGPVAGSAARNGDCDDAEPATHPGATEQCNGADDDCDGTDDDGVVFVDWFPDADGDGWGAGLGVSDCVAPAGHSDRSGDCDDGEVLVNPGSAETCNGVDDDCAGGVDDGLPFDPWYVDADGDGYGVAPGALRCGPIRGESDRAGDCDDTDPTRSPDREEAACDGLDNDCDAATPDQADADGDGYGSCEDCDDGEPDVFPGRPEIACNGADDDCDDASLDDPGDVDGDGHLACVDDCEDGDPGVPGAAELACNSVDDDCDPRTPDGPDADGDGAAATPCGSDCDDADPGRFPGAIEVCDGVDQDCDGVADQGFPVIDWYLDLDGDGFGAGVPSPACAPVPGRVPDGRDCDDAEPAVFPGNLEQRCDLVDGDCDPGTPDEVDGDGDGTTSCTDCDDTDPARAPAFAELACNGVDDDCDGTTSDTPDADEDGIGACAGDCDDADPAIPAVELACNGLDDDCDPVTADAPDEDADGSDACADCDDDDPDRFPSAPEVPGDGIDQDCDGADAEPGDTGTPGDTADPRPIDPVVPRFAAHCGCESGGSGGAAGIVAMLLAGSARRRRQPTV